MRVDCHPYLLMKIIMQDIRHEHQSSFSVYNYNVPFYSEGKCYQSVLLLLYQSILVWNSIPLYIRNCDSLRLLKVLYKQYLLTCQ